MVKSWLDLLLPDKQPHHQWHLQVVCVQGIHALNNSKNLAQDTPIQCSNGSYIVCHQWGRESSPATTRGMGNSHGQQSNTGQMVSIEPLLCYHSELTLAVPCPNDSDSTSPTLSLCTSPPTYTKNLNLLIQPTSMDLNAATSGINILWGARAYTPSAPLMPLIIKML